MLPAPSARCSRCFSFSAALSHPCSRALPSCPVLPPRVCPAVNACIFGSLIADNIAMMHKIALILLVAAAAPALGRVLLAEETLTCVSSVVKVSRSERHACMLSTATSPHVCHSQACAVRYPHECRAGRSGLPHLHGAVRLCPVHALGISCTTCHTCCLPPTDAPARCHLRCPCRPPFRSSRPPCLPRRPAPHAHACSITSPHRITTVRT